MEYNEVMENAARVFEILGVIVILAGLFFSIFKSLRDHFGSEAFFIHTRRNFGRPLLLGLEILVAADIIETITIDRSLEQALILAILVLVRVTLSFALDVELDGMAPWRRAEYEARMATSGGDD